MRRAPRSGGMVDCSTGCPNAAAAAQLNRAAWLTPAPRSCCPSCCCQTRQTGLPPCPGLAQTCPAGMGREAGREQQALRQRVRACGAIWACRCRAGGGGGHPSEGPTFFGSGCGAASEMPMVVRREGAALPACGGGGCCCCCAASCWLVAPAMGGALPMPPRLSEALRSRASQSYFSVASAARRMIWWWFLATDMAGFCSGLQQVQGAWVAREVDKTSMMPAQSCACRSSLPWPPRLRRPRLATAQAPTLAPHLVRDADEQRDGPARLVVQLLGAAPLAGLAGRVKVLNHALAQVDGDLRECGVGKRSRGACDSRCKERPHAGHDATAYAKEGQTKSG